MPGWQCAHCSAPLRKYVQVVIEMPRGSYTMSKQRIALDDITIKGADWNREFAFCPGCHWQQSDRPRPTTSEPPPIEDGRDPLKKPPRGDYDL